MGPPEHARKVWFERARIGKPATTVIGITPTSRSQHGSLVAPATHGTYVSERSMHFDVPSADIPALSLDLGPMCLASVTGLDVDTYSIDLHSEVCCGDQRQAESLLQRLSFEGERGAFVLQTPPNFGPIRSQSYLDVVGPADRPIIITGKYAKVEISGITAPVTVVMSHSTVSLFDVVGRVDTSVREGFIVFVGAHGDAYLDADSGIDMKLTGREYQGTIYSRATGPVFALIPKGFTTSFEINVSRAEQVVCGAELLSKLKKRHENGIVIATYGSNSQAALQFVSLAETVTIDTDV